MCMCMCMHGAWCMCMCLSSAAPYRSTQLYLAAPTTSMQHAIRTLRTLLTLLTLRTLRTLLTLRTLTQGALLLYEHALPALCRAMLSIELRGDWRCA